MLWTAFDGVIVRSEAKINVLDVCLSCNVCIDYIYLVAVPGYMPGRISDRVCLCVCACVRRCLRVCMRACTIAYCLSSCICHCVHSSLSFVLLRLKADRERQEKLAKARLQARRNKRDQAKKVEETEEDLEDINDPSKLQVSVFAYIQGFCKVSSFQELPV